VGEEMAGEDAREIKLFYGDMRRLGKGIVALFRLSPRNFTSWSR
jgi:hypothetical protein